MREPPTFDLKSLQCAIRASRDLRIHVPQAALQVVEFQRRRALRVEILIHAE
jgi:hypothetical protein